jgi:hypothetical protein
MSTTIGPLIGFLCGGFFILLFAGVGAFLIYKSFRDRKKADTSQTWPSTPGQITEARVVRSRRTDSEGDVDYSYAPAIQYTYQVGGQEYTGDNITFGFRQTFGSQAKAEAALARFPTGGQVTVYYDPNNPGEAVLERKAGGSTLSLVLGIVFLVISLCLGCPVLLYLLLGVWSTSTVSP